ncbi:hypothetical protein N798_12360 [Knoellia flava TL1]|uniref:Uncharacterized protein n=2 Tax=Knoellia flava TaxID=913969 RepID=A0A8H9KTA0_9MICO|nr:hypothetical protein [Knoellia flava]KGN29845.1 hypothetical protein N798_12360 [Knoellia flava TL1]GGB84897.1 hypothetical protein GCM10011314_25710 [Knoellia flava]
MSRGSSQRPWWRHADVVGGVVASVLATVVGVVSLRAWEWRPGVPPSLVGDSPVVLTQIDEILVHGWFWESAFVGFPWGQNASFFPELNVIHVLGVKALGLLGGDAATTGSAYFLLGYPLVALTTYLLARSERLRRPASVVVAVLFAAAPYHAERFEHLWLASYWTLPLGVWVALGVARGRSPLAPGQPRGRRFVLTLLALTLVGLSGAYYAGFTLILLAVALVLRPGSTGRARSLRGGLISMVWLAAVTALPLVAAKIGMAGTSSTGPRPATRTALESERYAGRLIDLLLPWEGHRVEPLAALTQAYRDAGRPVTETLALGIVGVVGATALVLVGLRSLTSGNRAPERLRLWTAMWVATAAFYTVGGLGSVVALFATPQLRAWSRLSLVLLLLGLLAVGHWLSRPRGRRMAVALAALTLVVGVLDQTNPSRAPRYDDIATQLDGIRDYTGSLAAATSTGCGVLQLPVMRFPEGYLPQGYEANAQLVQHLTDRRLAWSHGGMSGTRAGDWTVGIELSDPSALVAGLRAAGFCAVEVDGAGVDPGSPAVTALTSRLGAPVARTPDGRLQAWVLPDDARGTAADRERLLSPVVVGLVAGAITVDDRDVSQESGPRAGITTSNLSGETVRGVTVTMNVTALGAAARDVVVRRGDEVLARVTAVADRPTPLELVVDAPVGYQRLTVTVDGDPQRNAADRSVSARFENLRVRASTAARVVSTHDQARTRAVFP